MSDHVSPDLADFLENRLPPERHRRLVEHLDQCADCRAELAFAESLRAAALAQGLAHLRPERIVALAGSPEAASGLEARHLEACNACRRELEWAQGNADPEERRGSEGPRPESSDRVVPLRERPSRRRRWLAAFAALAAVLALAVLVLPRSTDRAPDYAGLIPAEPLPVRITRSAPPAEPFALARLSGLEAYRDGDYPGALARFGEALALVPGDPEMLLYAGSAELLQGESARAAALFSSGLEADATGALRAELLWQSAAAELRRGDIDAARLALEQLVDLAGPHAGDAEQVLAALR